MSDKERPLDIQRGGGGARMNFEIISALKIVKKKIAPKSTWKKKSAFKMLRKNAPKLDENKYLMVVKKIN